MQACTIGLSINEDPKLEKGKGKNSNATRSRVFIVSLSREIHVSPASSITSTITNSASAVTRLVKGF